MTLTDDKPSLTERYSTAIEASNLKLEADHQRAIDVVIAAAWADDGLGSMLCRLEAEYDAVRADMSVKRQRAADAEKAAEQEEKAMKYGPTRVRALRDQAAVDALSQRYELLSRLKSLPAVRQAFGRFAVREATLTKFMQTDAEVCAFAGLVLNVYLEKVCTWCGGRGFNGGEYSAAGAGKIICRRCHGSGKAASSVGRNNEERAFAGHLLARMEHEQAEAAARMKRLLHERE